MKERRMLFASGYGGHGAKIEITLDNGKSWYMVDDDEIEKVFLKAIEDRGYEITKTNKQKYERLKVYG